MDASDASPEAALCRELAEELELTVAPADLSPLCFASHAYDRFHLLMPCFLCRRWGGAPRGAEGQALRWVSAAELEGGTIAMPPADLPLLKPVLDAMRAAGSGCA